MVHQSDSACWVDVFRVVVRPGCSMVSCLATKWSDDNHPPLCEKLLFFPWQWVNSMSCNVLRSDRPVCKYVLCSVKPEVEGSIAIVKWRPDFGNAIDWGLYLSQRTARNWVEKPRWNSRGHYEKRNGLCAPPGWKNILL
jgi:hypothetical protein